MSNIAHLNHSFLVNETSTKCLGKQKIWLIVWYKNNVLMILYNCLCQFSLQLKPSIYQTYIQSWIRALHSLKFINDYTAIFLNDTCAYMWNNWKQLHIEPMTYHFVHIYFVVAAPCVYELKLFSLHCNYLLQKYK